MIEISDGQTTARPLWSRHMRTGLQTIVLGGFLLAAIATPQMPLGMGVAYAQEEASTEDRKIQEKQQRKKDKEFNREIQYRRVVGPKVLALGPYTVSLFVQGQPMEGRVRVAVQALTIPAKQQLEAQKWAVSGIVYPLTVRMFEQGRPTPKDIEAFKSSARDLLMRRYPDLIDDVFIESMF